MMALVSGEMNISLTVPHFFNCEAFFEVWHIFCKFAHFITYAAFF